MNRTGVFYLIFFITMSVAVACTYLMTQTHLGEKLEAEKHREISKVQNKQSKVVNIIKSKLVGKDYLLAISQINGLLIETKFELYKITTSSAKTSRLEALISKIKSVQNLKSLSEYNEYKGSLNMLLKQVADYPNQIQPLRIKLFKQMASIQYLSKKIRQLLIAAIEENNLSSLSRQHTLMIGKMLVQIQKIKLIINKIRNSAKSFSFTSNQASKLYKAIQLLNHYNQALLIGNAKDKIVILKTSQVKGLLLSVKVYLERMYHISNSSISSYKLLSSKSKELKNLLASIDKQKESH